MSFENKTLLKGMKLQLFDYSQSESIKVRRSNDIEDIILGCLYKIMIVKGIKMNTV